MIDFIMAILDDGGNVIGYSTEDGSGIEISKETHEQQLNNPGIYKWDGIEFQFFPYVQDLTESEKEYNEFSKNQAEKYKAIEHVATVEAQNVAKKSNEKDIFKISSLYPQFSSLIGEFVDREKILYIKNGSDIFLLNQSHTFAAHWEPGTAGTEALFSKVARPGEVSPWVQPTGGHDAYNKPGSGLPKSDPVTHKGEKWESLLNSNIWEPGAVMNPVPWKNITEGSKEKITGEKNWKKE